MTPVFCCGGECGVTGIGIGPHFQAIGSFGSATTPVRSGARSWRANPSSSIANGIPNIGMSGVNTQVLRGYIYIASNPTTNASVFGLYWTSGGYLYGLGYKSSDGKYYPARDDGVTLTLGSSGITIPTATWTLIDIKVVTSGNPHTVDVMVNGSALTTLSIALASGASLVGPILGTKQSNTFDIYFDDLLVSNTDGDYPIGAGFVNHFVPTSDGTHNVAGSNDFERGTLGTDIINSTTDSYLLVDDVPMDDTTPDTDDYINCIAPPNATDYTENKFGPASGITTPTTGPRAVEVCYAHHEAGTGLGVSAAKLNDNGTTADIYNPGSVAGVTTTRYARAHFATMPKDSAAWTAARFNDLRIRFGYSSDANPDQYFDCAMIEAEFAPLAAIQNNSRVISQAAKRAAFF